MFSLELAKQDTMTSGYVRIVCTKIKLPPLSGGHTTMFLRGVPSGFVLGESSSRPRKELSVSYEETLIEIHTVVIDCG